MIAGTKAEEMYLKSEVESMVKTATWRAWHEGYLAGIRNGRTGKKTLYPYHDKNILDEVNRD